ncbi:ectonucleotide pyrophosphatase/phosphodiesterase [Thermomonas paludicola]|uniref:alkaline phosphatase family protein n=1 Tax=Thermomonas paludicola TaxID=2884874 RepID=UPI00211431BA|nr:ectonucleotide pyrophosphatase/phosphodiesterase [Thermomonas paludicola]
MHRHFRTVALSLILLQAGCASTSSTHAPAAVLLVSVDGLRPTDITPAQMPVLDALGNANVRAVGMRPSYPALTFPNHYTLVTGLRPDHHGIIHNSMADAALGSFRTADRKAVETGDWWGGVPVWVSAERAGLRTATMFWPGSEAAIQGVRPRAWRAYDDDLPAPAAVTQVLRWLEVPAHQRPRFVTLYLDEVDEASHDHGPDSAQAITARREVDAAIGMLLDGLRQHGLLASTNVLVVSDHGFETVLPGHTLPVEALAPPDVAEAISDGQVIGFAPLPGKTADAEQRLLGRHDHSQCWRKQALPARWQYGTHPRIPAIVCQMDAGWDALRANKFEIRMQQPPSPRGSHGYDPDLPSMRASFIAAGPAFAHGVRLPVFDNVDVYPLLMYLLGLAPEGGDGDIAPLLPALQESH